MKFDENGKRKVYNIDLDGTLTNGEPFWDKEPTPNPTIVQAVHDCYAAGNIIIVHTARQWWCAPDVVAWLIKNRVPFHGLYCGKGGSDCYVDDKGLDPYEFAKRFVHET